MNELLLSLVAYDAALCHYRSSSLFAMTFNNSLDVPFQPAVGLEGGPESQNNIFLRLLKSRVIMLGSDVNDDVANQICA